MCHKTYKLYVFIIVNFVCFIKLNKVVLKEQMFYKSFPFMVAVKNRNYLCFLWNISLQKNEICDPEQIILLINHHIPDAKLKTENKEKLVYTLPLEKTNKLPGKWNMIMMGWNLEVNAHIIKTLIL